MMNEESLPEEHEEKRETPNQGSLVNDDRALAQALAARGVPPEEIQRLLSLSKSQGPQPPSTPVSAQSSAVPEAAAKSFKPQPTISFPEFRDATPADAEKAERLFRQASLHRRRGRFGEALNECLEAIHLTPRDAAGLELLGDILQALGRVDDALAAYQRASEADPKRATAEKKYAELLLLQDRTLSSGLHTEPRNPYMAVLLSALCPGAGQYYNGQVVKGLVMAVLALLLVVALLWTPFGFAGGGGVTASSAFLMTCLGALYIVSLVDANVTARASSRSSSGWDV